MATELNKWTPDQDTLQNAMKELQSAKKELKRETNAIAYHKIELALDMIKSVLFNEYPNQEYHLD